MRYYTVIELAKMYDVKKPVIQGWCKRKKFPNAIKERGAWKVPESDLKGFVKFEGRGRLRLTNPSKRTLYLRDLRKPLKEQAAQTTPSEPVYGYKGIDNKRDEICRLYETEEWTLRQIADHLQISKEAIRERLMRAGTQLRPPKPTRRIIDRETLVQLYINEKLPLVEIAQRLKTTYRKVCEELERHRIEKYSRQSLKRKYPELYELKVGENIIIRQPEAKDPGKRLRKNARKIGIKISVKKMAENNFQVTRIDGIKERAKGTMLGNKIIIFVMNFPLTTLFLFIVLLSSFAFAQKTNPDLQSTNVPTADEVDEALSNLKSFRNLHKYAGVSTKERVVLRNNFLPQVKNLQKKSPDRYGRTG